MRQRQTEMIEKDFRLFQFDEKKREASRLVMT
nr:MAG TPA: hypothetical protein [Caudoviricetes sp.]